MPTFAPETSSDAVIAQFGPNAPSRMRDVMASAVRHLHAFVRETRPTAAEWLAAIQFLTEVGQRSGDKRNDFILLSDLLGVSALVDAIDHQAAGSAATESTVLGPFFVEGARTLMHGDAVCDLESGEPTVVSARVRDLSDRPIADAVIDVWQTDGTGTYDVQRYDAADSTRAKLRSGPDGAFWFKTVRPVSYPVPTDGPVGELHLAMGRPIIRPAHLHFMIRADGFRNLTTHLFVAGDAHLGSDPVFGVKPSLIVPFERISEPTEAHRWGLKAPFWYVHHEFRLAGGGA